MSPGPLADYRVAVRGGEEERGGGCHCGGVTRRRLSLHGEGYAGPFYMFPWTDLETPFPLFMLLAVIRGT